MFLFILLLSLFYFIFIFIFILFYLFFICFYYYFRKVTYAFQPEEKVVCVSINSKTAIVVCENSVVYKSDVASMFVSFEIIDKLINKEINSVSATSTFFVFGSLHNSSPVNDKIYKYYNDTLEELKYPIPQGKRLVNFFSGNTMIYYHLSKNTIFYYFLFIFHFLFYLKFLKFFFFV